MDQLKCVNNEVPHQNQSAHHHRAMNMILTTPQYITAIRNYGLRSIKSMVNHYCYCLAESHVLCKRNHTRAAIAFNKRDPAKAEILTLMVNKWWAYPSKVAKLGQNTRNAHTKLSTYKKQLSDNHFGNTSFIVRTVAHFYDIIIGYCWCLGRGEWDGRGENVKYASSAMRIVCQHQSIHHHRHHNKSFAQNILSFRSMTGTGSLSLRALG